MVRIKAGDLVKKLNETVNSTAQENKTILIEGEKGNAVMISESDWNSINDILQVVSMSGIAESIREGLQFDIDTTAEHID